MPASSNRRLPIPLLLAAAILLPLLGLFAFMMRDTSLPENADARELPSLRDKMVVVGGIARPATDLESSTSTSIDQPNEDRNIGTIPHQKPDANPAVASAYQALTGNEHPERTSPLIAPNKFDLVAYKANPQAYLNVHEPGRVFQSAQPGPGVPVLTSATKKKHVIKQGESVRLQVNTLPNMPVTFASFDLGTFDNGLTTKTVAADASGLASAAFTGTSGVAGEINLIAASPVATERVNFQVFVVAPQTQASTP